LERRRSERLCRRRITDTGLSITGGNIRPNEQAQQDSDNYWQAVEDVAERIVEELSADEGDDRNETLHRLLYESTDQHDYVINDDLQLHVLRHSKHPCAAFFNGTMSGGYQSADDFPFAAFAADAFEADVAEKVKELLGG
jgi:cephalosporin-C deacetylase-like acetyl esterase